MAAMAVANAALLARGLQRDEAGGQQAKRRPPRARHRWPHWRRAPTASRTRTTSSACSARTASTWTRDSWTRWRTCSPRTRPWNTERRGVHRAGPHSRVPAQTRRQPQRPRRRRAQQSHAAAAAWFTWPTTGSPRRRAGARSSRPASSRQRASWGEGPYEIEYVKDRRRLEDQEAALVHHVQRALRRRLGAREAGGCARWRLREGFSAGQTAQRGATSLSRGVSAAVSLRQSCHWPGSPAPCRCQSTDPSLRLGARGGAARGA